MTPTRTVRRWVRVCSLRELQPGRGVAALVGDQQVAVFLLPAAGAGEPAGHLRAVDNRDPVTGANVLARGLLGATDGTDYVASPMLKHRFDLASGRCLDGVSPGVRVWPVRVWGTTVEVLSVTGSGGSDRSSAGEPGESPVAGGEAGSADPVGTATHCPFCALQCGLRVRARAGGAEVAAEPDFPVNAGRLCIKGLSAGSMIGHPERITTPLVRDEAGQLVPTDWDTALDLLAGRLRAVAEAHGPDAVGVFGSGALTNEKAYVLGKFARVALRTANVDYNGRWCMASAAAAANRVLGIDRGLPFPVSDSGDTAALVLWGANPADTMPPLMHWVDRMRGRGGRLLVVDPRRSATAAVADEHLQPVPGSDLALALGLLRLAGTEGLVDDDYVAGRTTGWEDLRRSVDEWTPERVHACSGITPRQLAGLLEALAGAGSGAGARSAMLLTGRGAEQQTTGTDTVTALISLMVVLGRVGRPASGYGCLTGQANGQGGREHGQKADQLPGYRLIAEPADREAVAAVWGLDPGELPGPGISATEMLHGAGREGGIRALVLAGSNPAVAAPGATRTLDALGRLDCVAVLDAFHSESTARAHFVLPVAQWAEEDGTVTNLEGRVLRRRRATDPPPGVRHDIDVLCDLADRLGRGRYFRFDGAASVFDEMGRASAGGRADYSGISYDRLDGGEPLYWPCPSGSHPGTPRLFTGRFAHPDGRAHLAPLAFRAPAESPDADYPVWLCTGRDREHYNSGAQTRLIDRLRTARPEPVLRVHPALAAATGIADGEDALVVSRRARARLRVQVTDDVRPDTVFAPFHWGGRHSVNRLTNPALDPTSRMPEFKVCAVRLEPVPPVSDPGPTRPGSEVLPL